MIDKNLLEKIKKIFVYIRNISSPQLRYIAVYYIDSNKIAFTAYWDIEDDYDEDEPYYLDVSKIETNGKMNQQKEMYTYNMVLNGEPNIKGTTRGENNCAYIFKCEDFDENGNDLNCISEKNISIIEDNIKDIRKRFREIGYWDI